MHKRKGGRRRGIESSVFSVSVTTSKQSATLALHACWTAQDADRGAATPPPLMVMIAAMFRSSVLDEVLNHDGRTGYFETCVTTPADPRVAEQTKAMLRCLSQAEIGDCDAFIALPCDFRSLVKTDRQNSVAQVLRPLFTTVARVAIARQSFLPYVHLFHKVIDSTLLGIEHMHNQLPFRLHHLFNVVEHDVFDFVVARSEPRGSADDKLRFDDVVDDYCNDRSRRQREVPLGDVRVLIRRRSTQEAVSLIWSHIQHGTFTLEKACEALVEAGCGDVVALLFTTGGARSSDFDFSGVQENARSAELRFILGRHGTEEDSDICDIGVQCSLLPAFDASGDATVNVAHPDDTLHMMFKWTHQHVAYASRAPGSPAYDNRISFDQRWRELLCGVLDGWDWSHCVAAGGSVVRALVGDGDCSFDGDVDLFFYGLSLADLRYRLHLLERQVRSRVGANNYAVLLTSKTMTIVIQHAPRIQIALGVWISVDDVLTTSDVDCCGAAFDGRDVWLTARAAAAYAARVNTATQCRHMVRGSIAFENRLWKYATRHGFAVLDPLHEEQSSAVEALRAELRFKYGENAKHASRRIAVSLEGLAWLMAADLKLFTPTLTKSVLGLKKRFHRC